MTVGYRVPTMVAVTTALAAGGTLFDSDSPPPNAIPIDLPVNRVPAAVAGGGQLLITWPAMGVGELGQVAKIGVSTDDAANTRITTRVDGVAVAPYNAVFGAVGSMENPTALAVPIRLGPGQVFSLLLENISGVAVNIAGRTMGWRAS